MTIEIFLIIRSRSPIVYKTSDYIALLGNLHWYFKYLNAVVVMKKKKRYSFSDLLSLIVFNLFYILSVDNHWSETFVIVENCLFFLPLCPYPLPSPSNFSQSAFCYYRLFCLSKRCIPQKTIISSDFYCKLVKNPYYFRVVQMLFTHKIFVSLSVVLIAESGTLWFKSRLGKGKKLQGYWINQHLHELCASSFPKYPKYIKYSQKRYEDYHYLSNR